MWRRLHLEDTARVLRAVMRRPPLRNAEIAFALAVTSEAAFTVTLGVVSFRSGGAAGVGLVALLRMLPSAVGTALITPYADRTNRVRVLAVVVVVRAAAIGACGLLLASDAPLATVYGLAVVATIAMAAFRPVHSALLPALCADTDELTSANVVRGVVEAAGMLVGPILAGALLTATSPSTTTLAIAAVSLASAVPVLALHEPPTIRPAQPVRAHLGRELVEGIRTVAHQHDLRLVFGLGFAQSAVRGAMNVFVVVLALDVLDTGDGGVAALSAALGVGGILGSFGASLLVGSRHLGAWLAIALALWGAPISVLGAAPGTAVGLLTLAVVGTANAFIDVPLFSLPVRLAGDAVLARAFGVFEAMISVGVALGSILGPALIGLTGVRPAMILTGLTLPTLALLSWHHLTSLDDRLGVREEEIRALRRTPMLGLLPVPIIEHLAGRLGRCSVPAGTTVVEQGTPGDRVYVIARGEADVIGNGRRMATLGEGDGFGEVAVVDRIARTATVRARTDLDLLELAGDDFLAAIGAHGPATEATRAVVDRRLATFRPMTLGA